MLAYPLEPKLLRLTFVFSSILYTYIHVHVLLLFCVLLKRRYKILCPKQIKEPMSPEKATEKILEHTNLDSESFRLGRTKVDPACVYTTLKLLLFLAWLLLMSILFCKVIFYSFINPTFSWMSYFSTVSSQVWISFFVFILFQSNERCSQFSIWCLISISIYFI